MCLTVVLLFLYPHENEADGWMSRRVRFWNGEMAQWVRNCTASMRTRVRILRPRVNPGGHSQLPVTQHGSRDMKFTEQSASPDSQKNGLWVYSKMFSQYIKWRKI